MILSYPGLLVSIHNLIFLAVEIARQLTLIDWSNWAKIKQWEFLGLAWTKPDKNTLAPHGSYFRYPANSFSDQNVREIQLGQFLGSNSYFDFGKREATLQDS